METNELNPLSKADLDNLSKALYHVNRGILMLDRAKAAGLEVTEIELRLRFQAEQIEAMLREFRRS